MRVFFDSSAFAKRYLSERGSDEVLAWCEKADELAISSIAIPEIISALNRLVREGILTNRQYQSTKSDLLADAVDVAICDLDANIVHEAIQCLERSVLRGMDAIHVACAVSLSVDSFITADKRQHEAAQLAGLKSIFIQ
jgi:uncharacterized protein